MSPRSDSLTQAQLLVQFAETAEIFRPEGDDRTYYASVTVDTHRETWKLRSGAFRSWLTERFHASTGKIPSAQPMQDALQALEGIAMTEGLRHPVPLRLASVPGALYLDLGGLDWNAIEITADGWCVVADPPVRFRRARGVLALPTPILGGRLEDLWRFLNVATEDDLILLIGWLVGALHPRGPYPVLVLHGEHGAAKSTTARVLRALLDPNRSPLRAEPRDERDLVIAASNGWVIGLDNLSDLSPWLSDALSRLATGGGFGTRQLHSDDDEMLFSGARPIVLNGIEEIVARPDLMDRSIVVELPPIDPVTRKRESEFWDEFELVRPALLGALCTAVVSALRRHEQTAPKLLPRMADFATWVTAAEPGLGWPAGRFLETYRRNLNAATHLALEASTIAGPLQEFMRIQHGEWSGRLSKLLEELEARVTEERRRQKDWPKTARGLRNHLTRLAPVLRAVGLTFTIGRDASANVAVISLIDTGKKNE